MAECKCGCGKEVSREGMFFRGHATESFLYLVSKEPKFQDELSDVFDVCNVPKIFHKLRGDGVPILKFAYSGLGVGHSDRNGIKPFVIYYLEQYKIRAFQRIRERYPARTSRIWIEVGMPMLGNAVKSMGSGSRYVLVKTRWGKRYIH